MQNLETITKKFMNLKHLCVYVMGTIETTYYDFSHLDHLEYLEIVNYHPDQHILPVGKNQKVNKDLQKILYSNFTFKHPEKVHLMLGARPN